MNPTLSLWLVVAIFSASYLGLALGKVPWLRIARAGIAYVQENMGIFSDLTVREHMLLAARSARSPLGTGRTL